MKNDGYEAAVDHLNACLSQICNQLNTDSLNYCVTIHCFNSLGVAGQRIDAIVQQALQSMAVKIGGSSIVSPDEMLSEVVSAISYQGDRGSHPNLDYLASSEFNSVKELIVHAVRRIVASAAQVMSFWIKEGHPFYPVFWDFAFLIECNSHAFVLIGSSSD